MGLAEQAELAVKLTLRDQLSAGLTAAERKLKGFDKATSRTQASLGKTAANLQHLGVIAATAAGGIVVGAIKLAADFEAQLNTINTIARETPAGLDRIGDSIRKVARDTGTSLDDLTQGYYDLLSAGVKAADATNVLTVSNRLAIGGISSTAEAINLLTGAINTYGGDAAKAGSYADVFAKAIERGKVTAADISATFATAGSLAAENGLEIEELAAAYARLTAANVPAAEAMTQVRSALVGLIRRTGDLEKLEKATGKSYLAIAGKKGLVFALEQLRKDAEKAGVPLIDLLGRVEGLNFATLTTGANFDKYNADLLAMGDAAGTAAEQMGIRQEGLTFQLGLLRAGLEDAGITIGSALLPKLTPLIQKLNDFITKNQGKIAELGTKLASGFQKFADAIGKVDWQPFIDGLRITSDIAKSAISAFMALPPEVRSIAIAGLAVNKLTGGLGSSIVKDLAGLALSGLKTIHAGHVTVVGASVTGGGGIGGGGGKGVGLLGLLGFAGLSLAIAEGVELGTKEVNRQTGSNFMGPSSPFWVSFPNNIANAIVLGMKTLNPSIFTPRKPNITGPSDREHEGAGFRPRPAGPTAFFRPDKADAQKNAAIIARASDRTTTAIEATRARLGGMLTTSTSATRAMGDRVSRSIDRKNWTVRIPVNVSQRTVINGRVYSAAVNRDVTYINGLPYGGTPQGGR